MSVMCLNLIIRRRSNHSEGSDPCRAASSVHLTEVMRSRLGIPERRHRTRDGVHGEPRRTELVARILGCYQEMPGLSLRLDQAARLFGLRTRTCEIVLEDLVRAGRLRRGPDGRYLRGES